MTFIYLLHPTKMSNSYLLVVGDGMCEGLRFFRRVEKNSIELKMAMPAKQVQNSTEKGLF